MLALADIKEHLRIDGEHEDRTLNLYVNAAVSAAEKYTRRKFKSQSVAQPVIIPRHGTNVFMLREKPTGPVVVEINFSGQTQRYSAVVSGLMATLPVHIEPCDAMVTLHYKVGPSDVCSGIVDTDPMIELGILQFIAHAWAHRGDGAHSWAMDSGAAEIWSSFKPVYFG